MDARRESRLVEAFVGLADTLVADYDVVDVLTVLAAQCRELLGATDAGIMLAAADGRLGVAASSSERSHLMGLLQLGADEGPCLECYRTGRVVDVRGHAAIAALWPEFATAAADRGYQSVHAVPMRLRDEAIGSLNLFFDRPRTLSEEDAEVARGLADVATISILHERVLRETTLARDQLQRALESRVLIEQAKGIIAHSDNVDMEEAFHRLRDRARSHSARLSEVARELIARSIGMEGGHPAG